MDPALVGKGAAPHKGLTRIGVHVGDLGDGAGKLPQPPEPFTLHTAAEPFLERDRGDNGTKVRVSAPLPPPVDGPLDVPRTLFNHDQAVSHSAL